MDSFVSVIIPTFNAEATISRALDSVRLQEFPNLEVVVVDDASTDGTAAAVRNWPHGPVRLLQRPSNGGAAAARNLGIYSARGEYVAFLDADDIWQPGKLNRQSAVLDARPEVSLVTCDCVIRDSEGALIKRTHAQHRPAAGPQAWKALLGRNFIPTPTVMARKRQLLDAGLFDTSLPVAEDLDLWIRLALLGEVAIVPEVLVTVYDRPGSLMKRHAHEEERILLSLLDTHLESQRHRLNASEVRAVMGQRYFQIGAKRFDGGLYMDSVRPFLRAALHGHRVAKSLVNLPRALAGHLLRQMQEEYR